jgi:dienelactone hydrolase
MAKTMRVRLAMRRHGQLLLAAALGGSSIGGVACSSHAISTEAVGGESAGGAGRDGFGGSAGEGCDVSLQPSAPSVELGSIGFEQPAPRGPHPVGTHIAWLDDPNRPELATLDADDTRGLWVQFFYPSEPSELAFGPLMDSRIAAVLTATRGFLAGFERQVQTHARFDVALANDVGPLPIVVYSHGQTTFPQENETIFEDLASRGWFVVALSHTYSAAATLLPSGVLARSKVPPQPSDGAGNDAWRKQRTAINELHDHTWVPDVKFVIDWLEQANAADCSWLMDRLDLERLGLVGYSFGGSTVFDVCIDDPRCKAAVGFDGGLWGELERDTDKPLMYMRVADHAAPEWDVLRQHHSGFSYGVWLVGADHGNFNQNYPLDTALRSSSLGVRRIDPNEAYQAVRDYTVAMLDTHVLGDADPRLSQASTEPTVLFERSPGGVVDGQVAVLGAVRNTAEVPIVGASISTAARETSSRELGSFLLDDVTPGTAFTLHVEHPSYLPLLVSFDVPRRFQSVRHLTLWTAAELDAVAGTDLLLDPTRGHVRLEASMAEAHLWAGSATGLTARVSGATFRYVSDGGSIEPALDTIGDLGSWAFAPNLQPGEHSIEVELDDATCVADLGDTATPNSARVVVEPGSLSFVSFRCSR